MLTIWGRATSTNVMKVLWALEELGLAYRRLDAGGPYAQTDQHGLRAISPLGLVPALQDGDFTLFESNAILRYLANSQPGGSALYPDEPKARAAVDAWLDLQQSALAGPAAAAFRLLSGGWPGAADTPEAQVALAQCGAVWRALEARLGQTRFLAGDGLSIADIAFGPALHQWFSLDLPNRPSLPHLRGWYGRLSAQPGFRVHIVDGVPVRALRPPLPPAARGWFRYDAHRDVLQNPVVAALPVLSARDAVMAPVRPVRAREMTA